MPGSEINITEDGVIHIKTTNADKIRSMSDEELALVVMCPNNIDEGRECPKGKNCYQCSRDWLQEEVDGC